MAENWRSANQETTTLIREVLDGQRESWLDQKNLQSLKTLALSPHSIYSELKEIDEAWLRHSNNRFGFSTQSKIFLKSGGKRFDVHAKEDLYGMKGLISFSDKVGWREDAPWYMSGNRKWISYRGLSFDGLPPVGHLPLPRVRFTGIMGGMMGMTSLATDGEDVHLDVQTAMIVSLWIGFLVSSF